MNFDIKILQEVCLRKCTAAQFNTCFKLKISIKYVEDCFEKSCFFHFQLFEYIQNACCLSKNNVKHAMLLTSLKLCKTESMYSNYPFSCF